MRDRSRSREPRRHVCAYAYEYQSPQQVENLVYTLDATRWRWRYQASNQPSRSIRRPRGNTRGNRDGDARVVINDSDRSSPHLPHKLGRVASVASVAMERGSCEAMLARMLRDLPLRTPHI